MSRYSNRDNNDNNTRRFTSDDEHNSRGNRSRFRDDEDFGGRRNAGGRSRRDGEHSRRDGEHSRRDGDSGSYDRQLYGRDDDPTQPGRQHPGQNRAASARHPFSRFASPEPRTTAHAPCSNSLGSAA